jgi:hypothetical protein
MAAKKFFFRLGEFSINDGSEIRFWENIGNTTLREQYHVLYYIVCRKDDTIVKVMETLPPNVTFGRNLLGHWLVAWNAILQCLANVYLQRGPDEFRWIFMRMVNFQSIPCTMP